MQLAKAKNEVETLGESEAKAMDLSTDAMKVISKVFSLTVLH